MSLPLDLLPLLGLPQLARVHWHQVGAATWRPLLERAVAQGLEGAPMALMRRCPELERGIPWKHDVLTGKAHCFAAGGRHVAIRCMNIYVCDVWTGKVLRDYPNPSEMLDDGDGELNSHSLHCELRLSPDGALLVMACNTGTYWKHADGRTGYERDVLSDVGGCAWTRTGASGSLRTGRGTGGLFATTRARCKSRAT